MNKTKTNSKNFLGNKQKTSTIKPLKDIRNLGVKNKIFYSRSKRKISDSTTEFSFMSKKTKILKNVSITKFLAKREDIMNLNLKEDYNDEDLVIDNNSSNFKYFSPNLGVFKITTKAEVFQTLSRDFLNESFNKFDYKSNIYTSILPFETLNSTIQPIEYLEEIEVEIMNKSSKIKVFQENEKLNYNMRSLLIDWLFRINLKMKLREETFFLAVNIIDMLIIKKMDKFLPHQLTKISIACLYCAAKYEEIDVQEMINYLEIEKDYESSLLLKLEYQVLSIFNFDICFTTLNQLTNFYYKKVESLFYDSKFFYFLNVVIHIKLEKFNGLDLKTISLGIFYLFFDLIIEEKNDFNDFYYFVFIYSKLESIDISSAIDYNNRFCEIRLEKLYKKYKSDLSLVNKTKEIIFLSFKEALEFDKRKDNHKYPTEIFSNFNDKKYEDESFTIKFRNLEKSFKENAQFYLRKQRDLNLEKTLFDSLKEYSNESFLIKLEKKKLN